MSETKFNMLEINLSTGEKKVILFNLSGHGFLDITAFNGNGMKAPC